jgi:PKD repeat protein
VQFANNTTGEADAYAWNFGDGTTSSGYAPKHTYDKPGTYSVRLDATGTGGASTDYKGSYITVLGAGPDAGFSASATRGPAPLNVQFTSESTGDITSYSWKFGDGSISSESNPAHAYKRGAVCRQGDGPRERGGRIPGPDRNCRCADRSC